MPVLFGFWGKATLSVSIWKKMLSWLEDIDSLMGALQ